ncbi:MAG: hypothetical protein WAP35_10165 [Solirubrobacterales bacterium]
MLLTALVAFSVAPTAEAGIFGTYPLSISVGPNGEAASGASGAPSGSGDNRYARLAAFHSDAGNLIAGDGNGGVADIYFKHLADGKRL